MVWPRVEYWRYQLIMGHDFCKPPTERAGLQGYGLIWLLVCLLVAWNRLSISQHGWFVTMMNWWIVHISHPPKMLVVPRANGDSEFWLNRVVNVIASCRIAIFISYARIRHVCVPWIRSVHPQLFSTRCVYYTCYIHTRSQTICHHGMYVTHPWDYHHLIKQ